MRLERVVNLLAALIDTERPLTRDEIWSRVPGYDGEPASARRAFERDKQMLRDMGIPLATELLDPDHPDDGTGYRIPKDDYQLPDPELTAEETAALGVAASAVRLRSQSATAALLKLGTAPQATAVADVDIAGEETLSTLFGARRERRTVKFRYRDAARTLDPHNLSFRSGRWYVTGYDHDHAMSRTYRLDRISSEIEVSDRDAFDQPPAPAQKFLFPWEIGEGEPIRVRVLVDADHADLMISQTSVHCVEARNADGSAVMVFACVNWDALQSFVLGFLDHAEIVAPIELRHDFATRLQQLVSQ